MVRFLGDFTNTMVAIDLVTQEHEAMHHALEKNESVEDLTCFNKDGNLTHQIK